MVRDEIRQLQALGAFPASNDVDVTKLELQEQLLGRVVAPISKEEARACAALLGPDDYFGLAWTIVHLMEGAPGCPLLDCLSVLHDEWKQRLLKRWGDKR